MNEQRLCQCGKPVHLKGKCLPCYDKNRNRKIKCTACGRTVFSKSKICGRCKYQHTRVSKRIFKPQGLCDWPRLCEECGRLIKYPGRRKCGACEQRQVRQRHPRIPKSARLFGRCDWPRLCECGRPVKKGRKCDACYMKIHFQKHRTSKRPYQKEMARREACVACGKSIGIQAECNLGMCKTCYMRQFYRKRSNRRRTLQFLAATLNLNQQGTK